jgi:hypothetical protein
MVPSMSWYCLTHCPLGGVHSILFLKGSPLGKDIRNGFTFALFPIYRYQATRCKDLARCKECKDRFIDNRKSYTKEMSLNGVQLGRYMSRHEEFRQGLRRSLGRGGQEKGDAVPGQVDTLPLVGRQVA